ncbi:MAG: FecR domain-containing protein [Bacteroidota bacterium]
MKITRELLIKYSRGECTKNEIVTVEEWLSSNEDDAMLSDLEFGDSIENVRHKLLGSLPELQAGPKVIPLYKRAMRYAAVVVILFTIGLLTYDYLSGDSRYTSGELAYFEDFQTVETKRGEKRTVILSDGSTIRMNYETEVRVPEKFEGNERVVYLTGHAHFDVARNPEKPFIIYTEDTKTQVLGTSFDINTKAADETEIIVTSGKVAFSEKDKLDNLVTLTLNDRALLGSDKSITTGKVDALSLTAWKDNRLVFNGQTLAEIIEVLEPWYDVEITVKNPEILKQDFKFSKNNPPLNEVFDRLSFLGDFDYRIEGKQVWLF